MTQGLSIPFTGLRAQYNHLRTEILDATDTVLRSGQLMDGNNTLEFEHWLAKRTHRLYAVTCHSGTQALEIMAQYLFEVVKQQVDRRSLSATPSVIIPNLTYVATANAFYRAGWNIHLVDTDAYGVLDGNKIRRELEWHVTLLVGLYGASVDNWYKWQPSHDQHLTVEDAAQHWLTASTSTPGSSMAVSFDPTKNLANYSNGGAVVTNDRDLAAFAKSWRSNGKPTHAAAGSNSRMSETDCAQLMVKTRYLDQWQQRRRAIAVHWLERLRSAPVRCLIDSHNIDQHCFHKFVIDLDSRNQLAQDLGVRKIETRIHYPHTIAETGIFKKSPSPNILGASYALSRRCLSLPLYPELTDLQVEYIIDRVLDCIL